MAEAAAATTAPDEQEPEPARLWNVAVENLKELRIDEAAAKQLARPLAAHGRTRLQSQYDNRSVHRILAKAGISETLDYVRSPQCKNSSSFQWFSK